MAGAACISALLYFSYYTCRELTAAENTLSASVEALRQRRRSLREDEQIFSESIATAQNTLENRKKQIQTVQNITRENDQPAERSVFSQVDSPENFNEAGESGSFGETAGTAPSGGEAEAFSDSGAAAAPGAPQSIDGSYGATEEDGTISPPRYAVSGQTDSGVFNGHIVGIDPGHQSSSVDMSALEPLGPGSGEMKAKSSTGTEGIYSGVPEYQLNLEVSLKLRDILEERGYQVVMTRTDNEAAVSNRKRAEYVAEMGAEIYVRIHANSEASHTASGALSMAPSPENPYVGDLSAESERLSQCILDSYCEATGFNNRGVSYDDNMTGINWSTVPVTILEMGFMSYESDDLQMNDDAFQDKMAEGIADGIDDYFK